ncbi:hypothetical protein IHQ71_11825 [Rhizobium sp. TH2]|uniref:hypothetical protein n=1 Tax=Rhizobium sp. TH2 TaxID=2775403 RepID=UPI0021575A05|nr:hypothetical protein [Rhizobium sp. TH2]UVC11196.1 hypothetical protein IHQ71_11825 [Rhizobium sp. TH2]
MFHSRHKHSERDFTLERLKAARVTVAQLLEEDPIYAPIFIRLENEIAAEEAKGDPLARARAIVATQSAMA